MRIPPLCGVRSPWAPSWGVPDFDADEVSGFYRRVALLVGANPQESTVEALGSGFLVGGTSQSVFIVTAAHVLFGRYLTNVARLRDKAAPFDGALSAEARRLEEAKALSNVIKEGLIAAFVTSDSGELVAHTIMDCSTGLDPWSLDVAFLQGVVFGEGQRAIDMTALPIDLETLRDGEVALAAGFAEIGSPWKVPSSEGAIAVPAWRKSLVVRVGHILEVTNKGEGARGNLPMIRTSIPTLPNMSGGPLLRVRQLRKASPIVGVASMWTEAAIGVISRGNPGGALFAHSHSPDGETWMTPIQALRALKMPCRGESLTLRELLNRGDLVDFSKLADRAKQLPPEPEDKNALVSGRLSYSGDQIVEIRRTPRK